MPKRSKGYISVRNCVDTDTMTVSTVMDIFNESYDICSECDGKGHTVDSSSNYIINGITTVKWGGNDLLENLNESDNLNGETIKKIIETVVHGRKQCDKCKGFGFVEKSRKKHGSKKT